MGICAQWCLQHGPCLSVIPVPPFPPAGAATAGIDVWLGEGAHVGMSAAGASGLVWHGVLQGLCHAAAMCSARWDLPSLGNVSLLLQMLACCQPSPAGAVTVARSRHIRRGVELLTAKLSWVLLSSLQPWSKKRCLEMLQRGGFGVTKERRGCVRTLLAPLQRLCSGLSGRFYLLGAGSALICHGHSSSPGPAAGEVGVCGRCRWDLSGDGCRPGAARSAASVRHICRDANMYAKEILAV